MRHEVVLETVRDELAVVGLSINAGQKCCQNSTSTFLVDPHRRTNSDYREHGRSQMAGLPVECGPREGTTLDKNYHVQAAAENFSANNTILGDRKVHVAAVRQRYFFFVSLPLWCIWLWTLHSVHSRLAQNGCCLPGIATQKD